MGCAVLEIVYGERTFRLVGDKSVFLRDWSPATPAWVENASFNAGLLSDGRRPFSRRFSNPLETFSIDIRGGTRDMTILLFRQLQAAMEMSANYWTSAGQSTPVYIKAQSSLESNPRYAVLVTYQFGNINNPFAQPFLQPNKKGYMRFDLVIERMHWTDTPPGNNGTAVAIGNSATYNSRTFGTVDFAQDDDPTTTPYEAFVVAKQVTSNLTHQYAFDSSLGTYSSNLLDSVATYAIFPSIGTPTGDIAYFGISTAVADSGPFSNLIFDIDPTTSWDVTIVWEYWSGATWTTLSLLFDGVDNFENTGVRAIHFNPPSNWAANDPGVGVTAFWIRARISAISSITVRPQQQNRLVYATQWPHVEIDNAQVPGDIPAKIQVQIKGFADNGDLGLFLAARSTVRGSLFQPYLNASDEQNPSGLTVTVSGAVFTTSTLAPTGRYALSTNANSSFNHNVLFEFDSALSRQFHGTFRLFVRGDTDDITNSKLRIKFRNGIAGETVYTGPALRFPSTNFCMVDAGVFTFPLANIDSSEGMLLTMELEIGNDDSTGVVSIYDVVLLPVDEWACELTTETFPIITTSDQIGQLVLVDSMKYPGKTIRAFSLANIAAAFIVETDTYLRYLKVISSGEAKLQPNQTQRLYIIPRWLCTSPTYPLVGVYVRRLSQYLTLRGDS